MTINDIRKHYEAKEGSAHWFEAGAMRFFNSIIYKTVYITPNDGTRAYFVTSEQYDADAPRRFSVRVYDFPTREIDTIGEFQQDATLEDALRRAKFLAGATVAANEGEE